MWEQACQSIYHKVGIWLSLYASQVYLVFFAHPFGDPNLASWERCSEKDPTLYMINTTIGSQNHKVNQSKK